MRMGHPDMENTAAPGSEHTDAGTDYDIGPSASVVAAHAHLRRMRISSEVSAHDRRDIDEEDEDEDEDRVQDRDGHVTMIRGEAPQSNAMATKHPRTNMGRPPSGARHQHS